MNEEQTIIRTDPAESYWLKAALLALDGRDPVDAFNDAQALAAAQERRLETLKVNSD